MDRATADDRGAEGAPRHSTPMTAPIVKSAGVASAPNAVKVTARDVCVFYGDKKALNEVSIEIPDRFAS